MNKTLLLLAAVLCSAALAAQPNEYFLKKLDADLANTACFDADSNLWLGARRGTQPLLLKVSRSGILLDQVPLSLAYSSSSSFTELLVDADGMLVGCGTMVPAVGGDHEASFVFRYDPQARELLWHRKLAHSFLFINGILEREPGGPFLAYGYNFDLQSTADMLLLERETGEIIPDYNFSYRVGFEETVQSAVFYKNALYATGKNDLGAFTVNQYVRQGVWRIDSSGAPVWALLGSVPDFQFSNLLGKDIIIDNDTIVSLSSGNETNQGGGNSPGNIYLQKTTLGGDLVWARKLDVTDFGYTVETAFDLIAVSDGYILYGGVASGLELDFLIKTDKNGNVLWAQNIKAAGANSNNPYFKPQSRLLTDGRALYVFSQIRENNRLYAALIKTDLNGNISGCDRLSPLFAREIPLANPFFSKKNLQRSASSAVSDETITDILPAAAQNIELLCSATDVTANPCRPGTFLQRLDSSLQLRCLVNNPADQLFVGGQAGADGLLASLDSSGVLNWTQRLTLQPGDSLSVTALILDSDQLLTGCGEVTDAAGQRSAWVFRFDPDSARLLWSTRLPSLPAGPGGVLEQSPGGNFLFYHNLQLPDGRQVPETVQLERLSGTLVPLSGRRYDFDTGNQVFGSMVALGPFLYAVGQNERQAQPQLALTRLNSNFGGLNWARLNIPDTTAQAFAGNGGSLCLDNNLPVCAYTGGNNGDPNQPQRLFLQRTSAFGDIIWLRYFDIPNVSEVDLQPLPGGGFILLAQTGPSAYVLLRTDLNGNLLVAKSLQLGSGAPVVQAPGFNPRRISQRGNYLFFILTDHSGSAATSYLLKTDLNLDATGPCALLKSLSPSSGTVIGPIAPSFSEGVFVNPVTGEMLTAEAQAAGWSAQQICPPPYQASALNLGPDLDICASDTAVLAASAPFASYLWQNGSTAPTLTTTAPGLYTLEVTDLCGRVQRDSLVLSVAPNPSRQIALAVAPNVPVVLGGVSYFSPDTVTLTIPSGTGVCDTLETYILGPCQPISTARTLTFYPGQTLVLDGISYDQPGVYTNTLLNAFGCDSMVTYTLEWIITNLNVQCPPDRVDSAALYQTSATVVYPLPTAVTDCPEPGLNTTLLAGLPPGSAFPLGKTAVCYELANACGIRDTCCFTVEVVATTPPCDVKTLPGGCIQVELLGIQLDSIGQRRYSIRVLNKCATAVDYLAIQLPKGVTAVVPANASIYTAASGNTYSVRNPNFSPFYSIRFRALSGSLNNGAGDVFEYVLPQQSSPAYVQVFVKLADGTTVETHLSALGCSPQPWNSQNRQSDTPDTEATADLLLWPNPTSGALFVDLQAWLGQAVHLEITNTQAQVLFAREILVEERVLSLPGAERWPAGLYHLAVRGADGTLRQGRFLVLR